MARGKWHPDRGQLERLQKSLPQIAGYDWNGKDLVEAQKTVHSFIRDGRLVVSAEHGDGAADYYYGKAGLPRIAPELEAWATARGGFWEWENPGCICYVED